MALGWRAVEDHFNSNKTCGVHVPAKMGTWLLKNTRLQQLSIHFCESLELRRRTHVHYLPTLLTSGGTFTRKGRAV